jgi:aminoglycoside 6-adenylyltransferase
MRNEKEMTDLIMGFAGSDERIRVVTMEGSRLNVNAPKDRFQDYDITFIVTEMASYRKSDEWLDVFGQRVMMQEPENMALFPPTLGNWYTYLMTFEDGNKMDLKLVPLNELEEYFAKVDSLVKVLLDKDGICPKIDEASDIDFHVKKPSAEFVDNCANEFWHLAFYVTKGICRGEILYAIKHLDLVRSQMLTMISWKVGIETSFSLSVGKAYKYLDKYVPSQTWVSIIKTYKNDSLKSIWDSLLICCDLFSQTSEFVAGRLGYKCPEYGKKMLPFVKQFEGSLPLS